MQVAMKIEKIGRTDNNRKSIPMLHNEQRMYKIMNGQGKLILKLIIFNESQNDIGFTLSAGIPHFFDYFPNSHGKAILVIELLGKSLDSLLESKKKFSIKTSMMIGLQVVCISAYVPGLLILTLNNVVDINFTAGNHRSTSQ